VNGQLALNLDAAMPSHEELLETRIRASVTEDGMSVGEVDAAVNDAFDRLGLRANGAAHARPCICENGSLLFLDALAADRRCARCGREPAR
jgi:hypothetical protein